MSEVILERDGAVLTMKLNRPERLNAFNAAMLDALNRACRVAAAPEIRAVVITGAGRGFCSGADIKGMGQGNPDRPVGLRHSQNPLALELRGLQKPVIAAVNGATAGAGLAILCSADIRFAAPTAKFVPAFGSIGVVPDLGATHFLLRDLGYTRTYEWLATGRTLTAEQALDWGLINEIVPASELLERAKRQAEELASRPARAMALTKTLLLRSLHASLADTLEYETEYQELAVSSPERDAAKAAVLDRIDSSRRTAPANLANADQNDAPER
jgi:2-(1,2-epoxy-1,2-dihydrophenyl)acetyl-CoA isomerase